MEIIRKLKQIFCFHKFKLFMIAETWRTVVNGETDLNSIAIKCKKCGKIKEYYL